MTRWTRLLHEAALAIASGGLKTDEVEAWQHMVYAVAKGTKVTQNVL